MANWRAGDGVGLLILRPQNVPLGPVIVTPWRFNRRGWIRRRSMSVGCAQCRVWSEVPSSALGGTIRCPHCGARLKVNPFTIDADWRPVAAGWGP